MWISFYGLTALTTICSSYKIVVFAPDISNSQVGWNKRVSETLAKAGHDVTVVLVQTIEDPDKDISFNSQVKVVPVNASSGLTRKDFEEFTKDTVFGDLPLWDPRHRQHITMFMGSLIEGCKLTVQNKKFMKWLTDEKFDIAFAHMYHTCPIALIHAAKIPTWIWLLSGQLIDTVGTLVGVPTYPSYVPPLMMESLDEMTFYERTKSFIGYNLANVMYPRMVVNKETAIMRQYWDPNFPDILDLASKCPLVMVNSNELYEFPRPTLAKVVNIGGLGVEHKDAKPLKENFKKIAETGKGLIVMSFGSVAQTEWMPEHWKTAILKAFSRFPEYQFVIRYVLDDLKDRLPPNVHTFSWLPQTDLLLHPNTKAFISHGGYNSLQEAINSGVPLITIALFGDQFKNSMIAAKHGFAVNIRKGEISEETLYAAVKEVLNNDKYSRNVKRLSLMVQKKPVSPEHLLIKWTEFVAEFKTLDNLVPAGTKLNFIQYYSIDVIGTLLLLAITILFIVYKTVKLLVLKCCCRSKKAKKE
ncbi:hypothetical protein V3C99_007540 [Haemonchus contortus]